MHMDRMYLLLQRLRRNKNFSRPAFAGLKASSRGFIEVLECFHHPTTSLQLRHTLHRMLAWSRSLEQQVLCPYSTAIVSSIRLPQERSSGI